MPAEWAKAAREQGGVVILVGDIGLDDTSQQFGDAITIAIAGSRVACDLAPATVG